VPASPTPDVAQNPFPAPAVAAPPPAPAATAADTTADTLPAPDPLVGPVPLPRHRPNGLVFAEGGIPLPRVRPAITPEPPPTTMTDTPGGYDPGLSHY
jgi:hypothetical protein